MDVFVARQPIFDRHRQVFAYELLFRSGLTNAFQPGQTEPDRASIKVIADSFLRFGIQKMTGGKRAFINFTRDTLIKGYATLLRASIAPLITSRKIKPLAEKIETRAEFDEAVSLGYAYLQGYFFSKPLVLSGRDVPGSQQRYLEVLREINKPSVDFAQIEDIVKREPSLTFKLMTYINSVAFAFRNRITSVRQALTLLGEDAVKKWASVVALAGLAQGQPSELIVTSLVRARFSETIAPSARLEERAQELFLMGLFSLLDAITGRPMSELMMNVAVADDIKLALLGNRNRLHDVLSCLVAYEQADWATFSLYAAKLRLDEVGAAQVYTDAVAWGAESFPGVIGTH